MGHSLALKLRPARFRLLVVEPATYIAWFKSKRHNRPWLDSLGLTSCAAVVSFAIANSQSLTLLDSLSNQLFAFRKLHRCLSSAHPKPKQKPTIRSVCVLVGVADSLARRTLCAAAVGHLYGANGAYACSCRQRSRTCDIRHMTQIQKPRPTEIKTPVKPAFLFLVGVNEQFSSYGFPWIP